MNVHEIILTALTLLGYRDTEPERYQSTAINAVNQVYSDLYYSSGKRNFEKVSSAEDIVNLPERLLVDVMPYGVAGFIAKSLGDSENQQYFGEMYNLKRKKAEASQSVQDVLPTV